MTDRELRNRRRILKLILEDNEVLIGGIFQKEKYYMNKYGLSLEDIGNMQVAIYAALKNIPVELKR